MPLWCFSRYFLEGKSEAPGGFFGIFGGSGATSPTRVEVAPSQTKSTDAAAKKAQEQAERKRQLEDRRSATAEAATKSREELQARKAEAIEQKKREADEAAARQKSAAEAKRAAAEELAQKRRQEQEAKKVAATKAAEQRKQEAEMKRSAAAAAVEAKKKTVAAEKVVKQAKPGATISLFGFGGGNEAKTEPAKPAASKQQPKKVAPPKKAPRGVPSLVNWRQNRDGSITGFISGSPNFPEGERITTSSIAKGTVGSGEVVQTGSGSSYFLAP